MNVIASAKQIQAIIKNLIQKIIKIDRIDEFNSSRFKTILLDIFLFRSENKFTMSENGEKSHLDKPKPPTLGRNDARNCI